MRVGSSDPCCSPRSTVQAQHADHVACCAQNLRSLSADVRPGQSPGYATGAGQGAGLTARDLLFPDSLADPYQFAMDPSGQPLGAAFLSVRHPAYSLDIAPQNLLQVYAKRGACELKLVCLPCPGMHHSCIVLRQPVEKRSGRRLWR